MIERGDVTPEAVNSMLFSGAASDVKRLYKSLTEEGRANARSAIITRAIEKSGGIENVSPQKFTAEMKKLTEQIGTFFNEEQKARANGLIKVLDATRRADDAAVMTMSGQQNYATLTALGLGSLAGASAIPAAATIGVLTRVLESHKCEICLSASARLSVDQRWSKK